MKPTALLSTPKFPAKQTLQSILIVLFGLIITACNAGNSADNSPDSNTPQTPRLNPTWQAMRPSSDPHPHIVFFKPYVDQYHNLYVSDQANYDIYKYNGSASTSTDGTPAGNWYNNFYNLPGNNLTPQPAPNYFVNSFFNYAIDPIGDVGASDVSGNIDFFAAYTFSLAPLITGYSFDRDPPIAFATTPNMTIYSAGAANIFRNSSPLPEFNLNSYLLLNMLFEEDTTTHFDYLVAIASSSSNSNQTINAYVCDDQAECNPNAVLSFPNPHFTSGGSPISAGGLNEFFMTRDNSGNIFAYDGQQEIYTISIENYTAGRTVASLLTTLPANFTLWSMAWSSTSNSLIIGGTNGTQAAVYSCQLISVSPGANLSCQSGWTNLGLAISSPVAVAGVDGQSGVIYALGVDGESAAVYQ